MTKLCFGCGLEKNLTDFYKHPKMNDGHLGKCKECCKSQNRTNRAKNIVHYQLYDNNRAKTTHRKLQAIDSQNRRRINHPNKYKARNAVFECD